MQARKLARCSSRPDWAGNHGIMRSLKYLLVSMGTAREISLGNREEIGIEIVRKRLAAHAAWNACL
jgi:hypothetical protein